MSHTKKQQHNITNNYIVTFVDSKVTITCNADCEIIYHVNS